MHFTQEGTATSIGEQPLKVLVDPQAGARLTVLEALANLAAAPVTHLKVCVFPRTHPQGHTVSATDPDKKKGFALPQLPYSPNTLVLCVCIGEYMPLWMGLKGDLFTKSLMI